MRNIYIVPDLVLDIVNNITIKNDILVLTMHKIKEYNTTTAYAEYTNFVRWGCKKMLNY